MAKRSEALSLSEEARAFGRDEHEAQLWEQFFSWPPPPPRAADLTFEPFEREPLPRGTRRAIWASSLMLVLSASAIGGFFAYHNYVMPAPAALGDWSDTDTLPLPTPILADDVAQADPEPRRLYQASLQHDVSAIKQAEPVVDEQGLGAGEARPGAARGADPAAQAPGDGQAIAPEPGGLAAHGPGPLGASAPAVSGAQTQEEASAAAPSSLGSQAQGEARAPVGAEASAAPSAQTQGNVRAPVGAAAGAPGAPEHDAANAVAPEAPVAKAPAAPGGPAHEVVSAVGPGASRAPVGAAAAAAPSAPAHDVASAVAPGAAAPVAQAQNHAEARSAAEPSAQVAEVKPVPAADAAVSFYEQLSVAQQQLAQGELRQSLPSFERALSLRAHSVDALLGKATALFGLKEYEAAKSSAQLALAIDPRSNEAFALIGGSLEWLGRRPEAKAIYERCIEEAVDATVCRERQTHLGASE